MPRTLSSRMTFFIKAIFPTLWIAGFGLGTLLVFLKNDKSFPQFFLGWIVGIVVFYFSYIRMKRVRRDEATLYISNYLKEIRVPFRDVAAVHQKTNSLHFAPVIIEFRRKTEFGDWICFWPKHRLFKGWPFSYRLSPVVTELREALQRPTE